VAAQLDGKKTGRDVRAEIAKFMQQNMKEELLPTAESHGHEQCFYLRFKILYVSEKMFQQSSKFTKHLQNCIKNLNIFQKT
jgi:hypothetical protein